MAQTRLSASVAESSAEPRSGRSRGGEPEDVLQDQHGAAGGSPDVQAAVLVTRYSQVRSEARPQLPDPADGGAVEVGELTNQDDLFDQWLAEHLSI